MLFLFETRGCVSLTDSVGSGSTPWSINDVIATPWSINDVSDILMRYKTMVGKFFLILVSIYEVIQTKTELDLGFCGPVCKFA